MVFPKKRRHFLAILMALSDGFLLKDIYINILNKYRIGKTHKKQFIQLLLLAVNKVIVFIEKNKA